MKEKIEILKSGYQINMEEQFLIMDKYQELFIEKGYFLNLHVIDVVKTQFKEELRTCINVKDVNDALWDLNENVIKRQVNYTKLSVRGLKDWNAVKNELLDLEAKNHINSDSGYDFNLLADFMFDLKLHNQPINKVPIKELMADVMDLSFGKMKNIDNLLMFLNNLQKELENEESYKKELMNIEKRLEGLEEEKTKSTIKSILIFFSENQKEKNEIGKEEEKELIEKKVFLEQKIKEIKYDKGVFDTVKVSLLKNYQKSLYSHNNEDNLVSLYKLLYTLKDGYINKLIELADVYCEIRNMKRVDFIKKLIGSNIEAMNPKAYQNHLTNQNENEKIGMRNKSSNLCGLTGLLNTLVISSPNDRDYLEVNKYIQECLIEYVNKIKTAPFVFKNGNISDIFRYFLKEYSFGSYGLDVFDESIEKLMNLFNVKIDDLRLYRVVEVNETVLELKLIDKKWEKLYLLENNRGETSELMVKFIKYIGEEKNKSLKGIKDIKISVKENEYSLYVKLDSPDNKEEIKNELCMLVKIVDKTLCNFKDDGRSTQDRITNLGTVLDSSDVFKEATTEYEMVSREMKLNKLLEDKKNEKSTNLNRKKI